MNDFHEGLLLYANTDSLLRRFSLAELSKDLPVEMLQKANRYRRQLDGANYLAGRQLLKKGMVELLGDFSFNALHFNEYGKPLYPKGFFSISHSGHFVAVAFSTQFALGLDIELPKPVDFSLFESYFSKKEWKNIYAVQNPLDLFYKYWRTKEAVLKVIGTGLRDLESLKDRVEEERIFIPHRPDTYYISHEKLAGIIDATICTKNEKIKWNIEQCYEF